MGEKLTWDQYLQKVAKEKGYDSNEYYDAHSEFMSWRTEQERIAKNGSEVSWTERDIAEFDYEGMTNMIETLGATSDEAAMIAQSQIDA